MSKYVTLKLEAYEQLCALIRESHSVSEGINDENVATNSTYSSKKIDELLNSIELTDYATKDFVKDYVDEAIKGLNNGGGDEDDEDEQSNFSTSVEDDVLVVNSDTDVSVDGETLVLGPNTRAFYENGILTV